jgi:hypothetical protein
MFDDFVVGFALVSEHLSFCFQLPNLFFDVPFGAGHGLPTYKGTVMVIVMVTSMFARGDEDS